MEDQVKIPKTATRGQKYGTKVNEAKSILSQSFTVTMLAGFPTDCELFLIGRDYRLENIQRDWIQVVLKAGS